MTTPHESIIEQYDELKSLFEDISQCRQELSLYDVGMFTTRGNEDTISNLERGISLYNCLVDKYNITIHTLLFEIDIQSRPDRPTYNFEKSYLDWYNNHYKLHPLSRV